MKEESEFGCQTVEEAYAPLDFEFIENYIKDEPSQKFDQAKGGCIDETGVNCGVIP